MEIRVEGRRSVGILRETWLENVEAYMTELEINREGIRDGMKWRRNVMKKEEVQLYRKTDYKPIIIIITFLIFIHEITLLMIFFYC